MKNPLFTRLLATAAVLSLPAITQAAEFQYRGWTGFQRHEDPAHGCIMGRHVDQEVYFLVYANDTEGFSIGVTSPLWELKVGDEVAGAASFDNAPPILLSGSVIEPDIILLSSGAEEDGIEPAVRRSRHIKLTFGREWLQTPLAGSTVAIDMLQECAEKSARAAYAETEPANRKKRVMPKEIIGQIGVGTLDSAITVTTNGSEKTYGFLTDSPIGSEIFKVRKMDDLCKVRGMVDEAREWIEAVSHVERPDN
jgi:hypothetical protein